MRIGIGLPWWVALFWYPLHFTAWALVAILLLIVFMIIWGVRAVMPQ